MNLMGSTFSSLAKYREYYCFWKAYFQNLRELNHLH